MCRAEVSGARARCRTGGRAGPGQAGRAGLSPASDTGSSRAGTCARIAPRPERRRPGAGAEVRAAQPESAPRLRRPQGEVGPPCPAPAPLTRRGRARPPSPARCDPAAPTPTPPAERSAPARRAPAAPAGRRSALAPAAPARRGRPPPPSLPSPAPREQHPPPPPGPAPATAAAPARGAQHGGAHRWAWVPPSCCTDSCHLVRRRGGLPATRGGRRWNRRLRRDAEGDHHPAAGPVREPE